MAVPFLDLKAQYASLASEIDDAIAGVIESQHFILGPAVEQFERAFADAVGTKYGIGVGSGTDPLLLSVRALGLDEAAEVIVPSFTFFVDGIRPPAVAPGNEHVYNVYTVRAERRDELRAHLQQHGIATNVYYPLPLHLQPCFTELGGRAGDLPLSERLASEVSSLPIFPAMTEEQVAEVTDPVRRFYRS